MTCRQYENTLHQFQSGMLSPDEGQGFSENLKLFFETELSNRYWAGDQRTFGPAFREVVEEAHAELAESDGLGMAGGSQLMRPNEVDA